MKRIHDTEYSLVERLSLAVLLWWVLSLSLVNTIAVFMLAEGSMSAEVHNVLWVYSPPLGAVLIILATFFEPTRSFVNGLIVWKLGREKEQAANAEGK